MFAYRDHGLDTGSINGRWQTQGLCRNLDAEQWFPIGSENAAAQAICQGCPVKDLCAQWAIANRQIHGIWGGMSEPTLRRHVIGVIENHPPALAQAGKTECPQGHPYDEANTYLDKWGGRKCRACNAEAAAVYRATRGFPDSEVCGRGHLRTPENTYVHPATGERQCKPCRTAARQARELRAGPDKDAKHGRHSAKTHCLRDHAYNEANTYVDPHGKRQCRKCKSLRKKATSGAGAS